MNVEKIERIEDLIELDEGKKIIGYKIKRLTTAGENYGSLMLSVDIQVKTHEVNEEISAVAKMIPPNDFMQEWFNVQVSFPNEVAFYKTMVPTLQNFQKKHGVEKVIDFFPKYYGSRLNLNGGTKVDSDGVLLLENLKTENYINLDRTEGFDLEISKLFIIDLAYFHAVPLALKFQKPEVFEKKIKQYLAFWKIKEDNKGNVLGKIIGLFESIDECKPFMERIRKVLSIFPIQPGREPFASVSHNDCWTNNIMVKLENNRPTKLKLVDFQVCHYGSPVKDLLFFLFSSVQTHVLEKHYDDLIQLYHKTFVSVLLELKCDIEQLFSFEAFEKELNYEATNSQFLHVVFMLFPIFAPKGSVKEIPELTPDNLFQSEVPEVHKQKLVFVVKEFAKRNWI